jgi:propanol-preferring alcohol dehydrogenase
MKAALLREIGKPLSIEDIDVPDIGPHEVLIKTHTCGICRTDIHVQEGLAYVPNLPHIPGHEPAGVIAKLGDQVKGLTVGQRVVPHLFMTCGHCYYCRTGQDAQCTNVDGIIGVTRPGAFAEYFKAPARNILPLPDAVPFEIGGLVSCAVITAVHAYRRARLSVSDTAVIVGSGGIGQILVQILKAAGCRVAALSRSQASIDIAKSVGADVIAKFSDHDAVDKIKQLSGRDGAHCVFECVGTADTMKLASQCICRGGQIIVIGEEADFPAIDTVNIAQREIEIIGSRNGSSQDALDALAMMADGIINPPIIKRYPLDQVNEALDFVRSGQSHGRVVINVASQ